MDEYRPESISRYQQIMGILRLPIQLGKFDILSEVTMLSQYQQSLLKRYFEALYLIWHHLKKNSFDRKMFYYRKPNISKFSFCMGTNWKGLYSNMEKEGTKHMTEPLGKPSMISALLMLTKLDLLCSGGHMHIFCPMPQYWHCVRDKGWLNLAPKDLS